MLRFTKSTVLGIVAALGIAVGAFAQGQPGGMPHRMEGQKPRMGAMGHPMEVMSKLKLTDQQKQQVHELMAANQSERQETMEQMRKLHEQLRDQIFADAGPSADAEGTARQINEIHEKMMRSQIELHEQIAKILDPEQRKTMRSMPMPGMMGMMGPMGHGPAMAKKPAPKK